MPNEVEIGRRERRVHGQTALATISRPDNNFEGSKILSELEIYRV